MDVVARSVSSKSGDPFAWSTSSATLPCCVCECLQLLLLLFLLQLVVSIVVVVVVVVVVLVNLCCSPRQEKIRPNLIITPSHAWRHRHDALRYSGKKKKKEKTILWHWTFLFPKKSAKMKIWSFACFGIFFGLLSVSTHERFSNSWSQGELNTP